MRPERENPSSRIFLLGFEHFAIVYLPESGEIVSRFETARDAVRVEARHDARSE